MSDAHSLKSGHADPCVFRREGECWTIAFAGTVCRLRDSAGVRHVAYLLGRPGERVPVMELVDSQPAKTDVTRQIERARVRVTHAIKNALQRIAVHHAELNIHLRATIKTGTSCAYLPDPRLSVDWKL